MLESQEMELKRRLLHVQTVTTGKTRPRQREQAWGREGSGGHSAEFQKQ